MHLFHLGNSTFVYSNVTLCCFYDPKQLYFVNVLYRAIPYVRLTLMFQQFTDSLNTLMSTSKRP